MTRKDVFEGYTIDQVGIIRNLGKFQGEMLYAPYFYDAMLNGDGEIDESDDTVTWFDVVDDDRAEFPELGKAKRVSLYETDQGFVYVETY